MINCVTEEKIRQLEDELLSLLKEQDNETKEGKMWMNYSEAIGKRRFYAQQREIADKEKKEPPISR